MESLELFKLVNWGYLGAGTVMAVSTMGSGIGMWIVGQAVVAAWKKCYAQNKPAPMLLLVFGGMPLSQTFYGFIIMLQLLPASYAHPEYGMLYMAVGLTAGISMMLTAISQGKISASAADSQAETGKGFAQYISVIGIAESIALFCMVFSLIVISTSLAW